MAPNLAGFTAAPYQTKPYISAAVDVNVGLEAAINPARFGAIPT